MRVAGLLGVGLLLAALGLAAGATDQEAANRISFTAENWFEEPEGTFHAWRVSGLRADPEDLAGSYVEVVVDVASIDTGVDRRDAHLRSADFFEVKKYPTAKVRVSGVEASGLSARGRPLYTADFALTIRDVSKTVQGWFELVAETPPTVEGELEINRVEFGVGEPHSRWNPMSIGEEIPIRFRAELER